MKSLKFEIRSEVVRNAKLTFLFFFVLFLVFAGFDFREIFLESGPKGFNVLTGLVLVFGAIACVTASIRMFRHGSPSQNFVSLDDQGLVYTLWGHCRKWSWQELPSFELCKGSFLARPFIRFEVPDAADWKTRIGMKPSMKVSSGKLVMLVKDVYNSPLDEIADRLNEYRDGSRGQTP